LTFIHVSRFKKIQKKKIAPPPPVPGLPHESGFSAARGTCAGNVVGADDANIRASF